MPLMRLRYGGSAARWDARVPGQQQRLPRLGPADRPHGRGTRRRSRHRLRPLPRRPDRLDLTPDDYPAQPLSSTAHRLSPVIFDDPQFASRSFERWGASGQSRTAFFAGSGRAIRSADDGITANAVPPGAVSTNLARRVDPAVLADLIASSGDLNSRRSSKARAAGGFVAVSAQLEGVRGRYFADCEEAPVVEPGAAGGRGFGVAAFAIDPDNARRLWDLIDYAVVGAGSSGMCSGGPVVGGSGHVRRARRGRRKRQ